MDKVQIGISLTPPQYRALARIADQKETQVHRLIEHLVSRALLSPGSPQPAPDRTAAPAVSAPKPKRWTKDLFAETLRELHAEGLNDRALAEALGVCRDTARQHRIRLGLQPNYAPARSRVDTDELRRLHGTGMNDREIAQQMHLATETIRSYRHRLALPKNTAAGRPRKEAAA